jgi:hypothetical protein
VLTLASPKNGGSSIGATPFTAFQEATSWRTTDSGAAEMAMPWSWQGFVHRYAERAATLADYSKALALI